MNDRTEQATIRALKTLGSLDLAPHQLYAILNVLNDLVSAYVTDVGEKAIRIIEEETDETA